ncbi:MAG: ABC transporter permease [Candidatus Binataceae bacterium]
MRRNLRRVLLTAATIALATFIFTVLISVPASMDRIIANATKTLRLIVNNRSAWYGIPARYCNEITAMPGAAACVAVTGWPSYYRDPSDTIMAAATGFGMADVFPDYETSKEQSLAMLNDRRGAIVGKVLMKRFNWKIGQQVTLRSADARSFDMTFNIVGEIPSERYPNVFLFRRDYFEERLKANGSPAGDIAWQLVVRAADPQSAASLGKAIDERYHNSDYETRTLTESEAIASGLSAIGNLRAIVAMIGAVVIVTVLLIAANSTAMMVRDRLSEVAVMRVLGFSRGPVSLVLFGECGVIGLFGGIVGAGAALWMFGGGITLGPLLAGNGALWVTPESAALATVIAAGVGIVSGVMPIATALRIAPAIAVRQVV